MPRVSIITTAYNHAEYIGRCIESVQSGSYQDWEMIIVDDGSTDQTVSVVESYKDARIRLLKRENGGITRLHEAYNLALAQAQGALIAILEGDDYWPTNKLDIQVPEFDAEEVVLVSGFAEIVTDEGETLGLNPPKAKAEPVRNNRPVGSATRAMFHPSTLMFTFPVATMLRKSALLKIGGFRQPAHLPLVDYPTFLSLSLEGEFRFVPEVCGYWRRHDHSTTKNRFPDIMNGCYQETMEFAWKERERMGLSDEDLLKIEGQWEQHQAYRCTLMGRMLSAEGRSKEAARAFRIGNKFRRTKSSRLIASFASALASVGLRVERLYLLAHPGSPPDQLRDLVFFMDDPLVRTSDVDYDWPIYRRGRRV